MYQLDVICRIFVIYFACIQMTGNHIAYYTKLILISLF